MKKFILALASAACCVAASPVLASDSQAPLTVTGHPGRDVLDDPNTIRVAYGDLNLANPGEAAMLRSRVKQAASKECRSMYGDSAVTYSWACEGVAWSAAKPQIDAAISRAGTALAGRAIVIRFARR